MIRALLLPWRLLRRGVPLALLLLLLASLALNAALVTVPAVFAAASALAERAQLPTARRAYQARLSSAEATNRRLATRASRQNVSLMNQTRRASAHAAARRALAGRLATAAEIVASRTRTISRRVRRASVRNVASMAGEAAPFVGIGVIVGTTAWELKDACDTLKDLRELDSALNPAGPVEADEVCGMTVPSVRDMCEAAGLPTGWCVRVAAEGALP